jgi:hypothetical protein
MLIRFEAVIIYQRFALDLLDARDADLLLLMLFNCVFDSFPYEIVLKDRFLLDLLGDCEIPKFKGRLVRIVLITRRGFP